MKTLFSIVMASTALTSTSWAARGNSYDCGNTRNEWYSEYVTLNSPDEYNGPGYIDSCKQERTFTDSAKKPSRITYVCHVTLEQTAKN